MIEINSELCIGCGICVKDCVVGIITLKEGKAVCKNSCINCGHCVAICPRGAVSIPEYDMDEVEEFDNKENFTLDSQVLLKAIKFRRSIRSYRQLPVEQTKINSIVNAGRYTATAVNSQDCCFIIVQDKLLEFKDLVWEELDLILQEAGKDLAKEMRPYALFNARRKKNPQDDYLFRNAPSVVFIASDYPLDAGLAAQNMELMAVSEGLGMLYNGYLVRAAQMSDKVKKWLEIGEKEIYACMLLGYPDVVYKRTAPRRQASTIFK